MIANDFMSKKVKSSLKILATVMSISIAAQITINIGAIPITGQTLAILAWACFLSYKESIMALFIYLILGFLGLPIFADGAYGIEKLYGGSGGFLIGFVFAAGIVSFLFGRLKSSSFFSIIGLTLLGTTIILAFGVARLIMLYGIEKGVEYGLLPFWQGAIVKIVFGSLLVWIVKRYHQ
jgi:biotin transport system substrate-specific component